MVYILNSWELIRILSTRPCTFRAFTFLVQRAERSAAIRTDPHSSNAPSSFPSQLRPWSYHRYYIPLDMKHGPTGCSEACVSPEIRHNITFSFRIKIKQ
uniref:Uncharacterized protein n=1 Tax=Amphimedon queenslandica TaxID=400682 RepID=A0A1X7SL86_AMPQE